MAKISLNNIAEELAARNNLAREVADNFMRAFVEAIEKGLQEDGVVKVKGLGTFKLQEMSDRGSVDVNTGERITIKGYRKVTFTPDSTMKEFVNRPFAHFEPTELNDGYPTEDESAMPDDDLVNENEEVEVTEEPTASVVAEPTEAAEPIVEESVVEEKNTEVMVEEVAEPESPVEEPAEAVEEVTESTAEYVEENSKENTEETVEETIEKNIEETIEETVGETVEEVIEENQEEIEPEETAEEVFVTVAEPIEEPAETTKQSAPVVEETPQSKPKETKKRRGGGWLIVLILVAVAVGVYYWYTAELVFGGHLYADDTEVYDDMMVNPNLEKELGAEWGDEPEVETQLPSSKDVMPAVSEIPSESPAVSAEEKAKPQTSEVTVPVVESKYCIVTIIGSLQAKDIKDITPADTVDYIMDGTLVTHELKNGETIIQLARKYYGDKRLWPYIVKYNWMKDPDHVAKGQLINIPVLKEKPVE